MADRLLSVNVLEQPGLYAVRSTSPTVYYVDSRDPSRPRYLRARGDGFSIASHMDDEWHDLWALRPVTDLLGVGVVLVNLDWRLMVGAGHYLETRRWGHPNGDVYWVVSRDCLEIERLKEIPPPDDLTIPERGVWP